MDGLQQVVVEDSTIDLFEGLPNEIVRFVAEECTGRWIDGLYRAIGGDGDGKREAGLRQLAPLEGGLECRAGVARELTGLKQAKTASV